MKKQMRVPRSPGTVTALLVLCQHTGCCTSVSVYSKPFLSLFITRSFIVLFFQNSKTLTSDNDHIWSHE